MNGEDNDAVVLIAGTAADLEDARADALRFGRQYAVRHWIVAPGQRISREQLFEFVHRLAAEFGFDPARAVIWRHAKDRAAGECAEHYHICVAEVNPVTGGVMNSHHDWRKHEKIARTVEVLWGHAIVPGRHTAAVVAALDREGNADLASALRDVAPVAHKQSFDEVAHQRLKRSGLDLPRLRVMIADALSSSVSRAEFDKKLAALGLRLRTGDQTDIPIIETTDTSIVVGSLARLTRLRKAALTERLKFNAAERATAKTDHPRSHVFSAQAAIGADRADDQARREQRQCGPAGSHGHDCRVVAAGRGRDRSGPHQVGQPGISPRRPGGGQGDQIGHARLKFVLGCLSHRNRLLDLLGEARRAALSPLERVTSDLDGLSERETRVHLIAPLPEPASLSTARRNVAATAQRLRALETKAEEIEQQLASHQPASIWQRLWQPAGDPREAAALQTRLHNLQRKILAARSNSAAAALVLKAEEQKFHIACAQHETAMSARRAQADARIATTHAARAFLEKNPHTARWGAPYLMRIAADIQKTRAEWWTAPDRDAPDDWSLIPILDLWGKPYLPPPSI